MVQALLLGKKWSFFAEDTEVPEGRFASAFKKMMTTAFIMWGLFDLLMIAALVALGEFKEIIENVFGVNLTMWIVGPLTMQLPTGYWMFTLNKKFQYWTAVRMAMDSDSSDG